MSLQPPPRNVLRGHQNAVNCITFVSSSILLSAASDGEARVWDLETKKCITAHMLHSKPIISIHPIPDALDVHEHRHFITNSRDGTLCMWDLESIASRTNTTPSPLLKLNHGMNHFCNATSSSNGPGLIASSSGEENQIWIWDIRSGNRIHCIAPKNKTEVSHGMVTCLQFDDTDVSTKLFGGYENGSISIFDIRNYKSLASELIHDEPIMAIDVNPKEAGIVTGSADKSLLYSRVKPNAPPKDKSLKPLHVSTLASADEISVPLQSRTRSLLSESFAWSNDLNNFGGSNSSIYHTTAAGSNKEDHHEGPLNIIKKFNFHLPKEGTSSVKFRADGRIIVSGHWDNTVRVFEAKSMRPLALLNHHRDSVFSIAFAPVSSGSSGALFASASKDGTIALWDLYADKIKIFK